jgi:hypothetical protein
MIYVAIAQNAVTWRFIHIDPSQALQSAQTLCAFFSGEGLNKIWGIGHVYESQSTVTRVLFGSEVRSRPSKLAAIELLAQLVSYHNPVHSSAVLAICASNA